MRNYFQSKNFWITGLVVLLIGFLYFFNTKKEEIVSIPEKILTPESYPKGTTVSLYKSIPSDFPQELILENEKLSYSGMVLVPGGGKQITVSYLSSKKIPELIKTYRGALEQNRWIVATEVVHLKVGTLSASRALERVIITTAIVQGKGTMVTLQYEK